MIYCVTVKKNLMKEVKKAKCKIKVPHGKSLCTPAWDLYLYIFIDLRESKDSMGEDLIP